MTSYNIFKWKIVIFVMFVNCNNVSEYYCFYNIFYPINGEHKRLLSGLDWSFDYFSCMSQNKKYKYDLFPQIALGQSRHRDAGH